MRALAHALALALLLPLMAPAAHAARPEPQDVELHLLPQPGDKMRQTIGMTMQMAVNMLPGPDMTQEQRAKLLEGAKRLGKGMQMDMKMTIRAEASEADAQGDYLLHLRGEGGQLKLRVADQPPKDMPYPMGRLELDALTNTGKQEFDILRVKGVLADTKDSKMLDDLGRGVIKQAFGRLSGLEGRRMKIGESVEVPFDMQMPMMKLPVQAHVNATAIYTLKAIHRGIASFDTAVQISMGMTPDEGQPQQTKVKLSGSGGGVLEYRIADRLPLRHDLDATLHLDMELPGGATTQMEIDMKMRSSAERYR